MKASDYFFSFLLLSIAGLLVYGFIQYFWIMIGLAVFSSALSFVVFLYQTKIKPPVAQEQLSDKTIDFYTTNNRTTYYTTGLQHEFESQQLKQANAD